MLKCVISANAHNSSSTSIYLIHNCILSTQEDSWHCKASMVHCVVLPTMPKHITGTLQNVSDHQTGIPAVAYTVSIVFDTTCQVTQQRPVDCMHKIVPASCCRITWHCRPACMLHNQAAHKSPSRKQAKGG